MNDKNKVQKDADVWANTIKELETNVDIIAAFKGDIALERENGGHNRGPELQQRREMGRNVERAAGKDVEQNRTVGTVDLEQRYGELEAKPSKNRSETAVVNATELVLTTDELQQARDEQVKTVLGSVIEALKDVRTTLKPDQGKQKALAEQTEKNEERSTANVPHNMLAEKVGILASLEDGLKGMLVQNGGNGPEKEGAKPEKANPAELGAISTPDVPNAKPPSQSQGWAKTK